MTRVGMIGFGAMGMPMARNVMKSGFPLTVWARREEQSRSIQDQGATWAGSPAELARACEIVITMVTNSPDVEALVCGPDGLLQGAERGLVIVDMSTIAPAVSRALAQTSQAQSVYFLDAPVSGGTQGAEAGALTIMVGGDAEALEKARPVLEAMGKNIVHVGQSGAGSIVKLVNNILVGVIAGATAEALVMGVKAGVDAETMAKVIGTSSGANWQLANQFPLRVFSGSFKPGFMTNLLVKDLSLALELGAETQVPLYYTALARQLYGATQSAGFGTDDYTSVIRLLETLAGANVRALPTEETVQAKGAKHD